MIVSSTTKPPINMQTHEIIKELITFTQSEGWESEFHCVVPKGLGNSTINKCRVYLSRAKNKAKRTGKPQRQFKLGSKPVMTQGEEEVVTFYLYQTRIDEAADQAQEIFSKLQTL